MADTAPSADDLLAHTDWLHQLARALVGDAAAGDVVQDTFEIALARPPKREGPLRPWLGGVARNVARMATRGRVRRERREEASVPAAEVPTPEELVARVQLQQRVASIVLSLHEPLRSTLLLRFFEGLTSSEIARAQAIPAATVRSRLKDALDRVRATLDEEHRGNRRAWTVLLVSPVALPSGSAALAGGMLVKTSLKVLIALVIAAVLVVGARFAGLWGGSNDEVAQKPAPAAKPAAPSKHAAPVPTPAVAAALREVPAFHDDDPKGPLRLEGQVIDDKDAPVAGAFVAIDTNPPRVVETEADGGFVFEELIPRDYRLEATAGDGYAGPARLRLDEKPEPVTLRLHRAGTLEVSVTAKRGGAPVKGAEVELRATLVWKAITDANGVATLRGVGATWAPLAVRANGFAPAALMLNTSGEAAERVAVSLAGGAPISGQIVDEGGKPVGGARVVATSASEPLPVIDPRRDAVLAGRDGTFTIPSVAAGTWRITATHGDFAPQTSVPLTVDGEHAKTGINLVLVGGGEVRGVVKDKAGNPVPAADVRVVARGYVFWRSRRQTFTDASGAFAISGLERREVELVAQHESGASAIVPVDLVANRTQELALVLDVGGTIAGTVVDTAGAPIGDAQVVAEPDWNGGTSDRAAWSVRGIQEAVTDQGGAFRFPGLPAGSYRVRAARPGTPEAALSLSPGVVAKPDTAPIKIVVRADGTLTGKLALADGKVPALAFLALGDTHPIAVSTKDGAFELTGAAGTHVLTISGPGFVQARKEVTISEGTNTDAGTLTLAAGRSIAGHVVDANGAPVAKATVAAGTLLTGGGNELYIKDESIGAKDTETDDEGRFVLDGFPPAAITLVAGKEGVGRSASVRMPPSTESATLDLVLAPTTGIGGKITRNGAPLADTVVIATPVGASAQNFFVVTGPDGTFVLDALAPGAYVVFPMLGGGGNRPKDMYVRRADVAIGKRAEVAIDTSPGTGSLAVSVKSDKGTPVAMAQVIAIAAAISPQTPDELQDGTRIPSDQVVPVYVRGAMGGSTEIEGMRPGMHTVCAILGGGPMPEPKAATMKCAQVKIAAGKATVSVTVPEPSAQ
ncbi:MAG: sigma-70 family RNA polymerase sigma factor [Kofleriaceae bacterium]|nr:sigma-70 family RNA polymerase sigma factor [Kofleriaceae bacterium]